MHERLKNAERYRKYAEELRLIAEDKHVPENRDALLKIAKDYEQMADSLEAVDQARQSFGTFEIPDGANSDTTPPAMFRRAYEG